MYFGMFIIRPDGNTPEFCKRFREYLADEKIGIIEEKEVLFTASEVAKYFFYQFPAYTEYMTSGKSRCIFVGSERADFDAKILQIKENLRSEFGVDKRFLKSLIHSSQSGTELFLQKKVFGDKYFSRDFVVGKDYDVRVPDLNSLPQLVSRINESRLFSVVFDIKPTDLASFEQAMSGQKLERADWGVSTSVIVEKPEYSYELILFIPREALKNIHPTSNLSLEELMGLSYSIGLGAVISEREKDVYDVATKEEYLGKLSEKYSALFFPILMETKITSIQMDSPSFSLQETDYRGDIAFDNGLKVFGGSSDFSLAGKFSYIYCYDEVVDLELQ